IAVVCLAGVLFALPNVLTPAQREALPGFLPDKAMNLGLDLQGGSHLLLEVDIGSVVREQLTNLVQSMRTELRSARIPYRNIGTTSDAATVTIIEPEANLDRARGILGDIEQGT